MVARQIIKCQCLLSRPAFMLIKIARPNLALCVPPQPSMSDATRRPCLKPKNGSKETNQPIDVRDEVIDGSCYGTHSIMMIIRLRQQRIARLRYASIYLPPEQFKQQHQNQYHLPARSFPATRPKTPLLITSLAKTPLFNYDLAYLLGAE